MSNIVVPVPVFGPVDVVNRSPEDLNPVFFQAFSQLIDVVAGLRKKLRKQKSRSKNDR